MNPLLTIDSLSPAAKAEVFAKHYPELHDHPSGIFYSLMKMDGGAIRAFQPKDFEGVYSFDFKNWRIKPEGPWEYRNNENSITTSGLWLAAEVMRYQATKDDGALRGAEKAYRSLRAIYDFGVQDGRPGWMGKPYGFRLSDQTSPDQYADALFGLWLYRSVTDEATISEIDRMVVDFADFWREANYTLFYLDRTWTCAEECHAYNAIFVALNCVAHFITGEEKYRDEAVRILGRGRWMFENKVDHFIQSIKQKEEKEWGPNALAGDTLEPGEFVCWETTIHAKFATVSAWIAHQACPDLVPESMVTSTLETWWPLWEVGMDEDFLPYYFFLIQAETGNWRPAEPTPRLPRDQWFLSQPGLSHTSQKRWTEPLARFMITSALAGKLAPSIAEPARNLAERMLKAIDAQRLRWQIDPDGKQLHDDQADVRDVLSSEIPASYCIAFWMGREAGWW